MLRRRGNLVGNRSKTLWGTKRQFTLLKCECDHPHLTIMARGWESKSVEQQQDLASSAHKARRPALTAEEAERQRQLASLRLARARVEQQLAVATNPRYRQTLE